MNKNIIIVGVIALLVGVGGGFFGGMKYQQSKTSQNTGGNTGAFQRGGGRVRGANGMAVRGQILSADNNSITVKMQDGSTKIIILSSSTMIGKSTTGAASDLTNGAMVTVFGTTNSDGSVTAQNVQVGNGMMFGGRPSGSPSASGSPTPQGY